MGYNDLESPLLESIFREYQQGAFAHRLHIPDRRERIKPLHPAVESLDEAAREVHFLHKFGAKTHFDRTIPLKTPPDRSALVAGYLHHEKGEGKHQHKVRTVLLILEGSFHVIVWNGKEWEGGTKGPGTFINMEADTPHLVEPHNPLDPKALNIIMVETLDPVSFKHGEGYNQPIPSHIPPIPAALLR